ncbi:hypothetical protein LCGC14_1001530 [marine sediment metagenome]|uniref:Uncharacterized protein n=1 Tax=marine sediment metagenome TaxID=412755 RepID=A0A0F9QLC4_9ZZZZ
MDELIEAAKQNDNQLFVMGLDQEELGRTQWLREIEDSGPVEVLLLKNHPHFENKRGTRIYILKET